jgi:Ca2+-binding RTX toxin-like protein
MGNANALSGLAGDDLIFDGLGKDKLTGGAGKDTFDFITSLEIGKGASRTLSLKVTDYLLFNNCVIAHSI